MLKPVLATAQSRPALHFLLFSASLQSFFALSFESVLSHQPAVHVKHIQIYKEYMFKHLRVHKKYINYKYI